MTRVLIAATSEIVRAGLETLVTASPALVAVGTSSGVDTLTQRVEDLQPDVVVLELELLDDETLAALLALGAGPGAAALVILADDAHGAWTAEALRSGVRAILPRQATGSEIVAAVESHPLPAYGCIAGQAFTPEVVQTMRPWMAGLIGVVAAT